MNRQLVAGAILLVCGVLFADEAPDPEGPPSGYWVIAVPVGAPDEIRREDYYEMSVYRLPGEPEVSHAAMLSSLCVSHTLVGQFRHGQRHCNEALEATREAVSGSGGTATELALAYSNRGVLRARAADPAGAEADFRAALGLQPETGIPARNLARLLKRETLP